MLERDCSRIVNAEPKHPAVSQRSLHSLMVIRHHITLPMQSGRLTRRMKLALRRSSQQSVLDRKRLWLQLLLALAARAQMLSMIPRSHTRPVTDIEWLPPTMEINRRGDFVDTKDSKCSFQVNWVKQRKLAQQLLQFVTVAGDSTLLFW